jgi:hypothetical protein
MKHLKTKKQSSISKKPVRKQSSSKKSSISRKPVRKQSSAKKSPISKKPIRKQSSGKKTIEKKSQHKKSFISKKDIDFIPVKKEAKKDIDFIPVKKEAKKDIDFIPVKKEAKKDMDFIPIQEDIKKDLKVGKTKNHILSIDDVKGNEVSKNIQQCISDPNFIWYENKCYENKTGTKIASPKFKFSNFDIPYKTPPQNNSYDCNKIEPILDDFPIPISERTLERVNETILPYFNCPIGSQNVILDSEVVEWQKQHPNLTKMGALSRSTLEWIETFLESNDKSYFAKSLSKQIINELSSFKLNKNVLLFRGIGFDKPTDKYMQNMCLNKFNKDKQYIIYKDERPSSWTWNYKVASDFASIKKYGFVLCCVFKPEDILVDLRLLCEYGDKFVKTECEVLVKPGAYYTRVVPMK